MTLEEAIARIDAAPDRIDDHERRLKALETAIFPPVYPMHALNLKHCAECGFYTANPCNGGTCANRSRRP